MGKANTAKTPARKAAASAGKKSSTRSAKPAEKTLAKAAAEKAPAPASSGSERRRRLTFSKDDIAKFDKALDVIEKPTPLRRESDEVTIAGIITKMKPKIVAKLRSGVTIQQIHLALEKSTGRDIPFEMFKRQITALKVIRSGLQLVYPSPQRRFTDENPDRRAVRSTTNRIRTNDNMPSLTTERREPELDDETVTASR